MNSDLTIRIQKRLTKAQVACMWDLFDRRTKCVGPGETILAFYEGAVFVGACQLRFDAFDLSKGRYPGKSPAFCIYVLLFEVANDMRGRGIGRRMYEMIEQEYNLYRVELCHRLETADQGASYRFWRRMGFHRPQAVYDMMVKNIKYRK